MNGNPSSWTELQGMSFIFPGGGDFQLQIFTLTLKQWLIGWLVGEGISKEQKWKMSHKEVPGLDLSEWYSLKIFSSYREWCERNADGRRGVCRRILISNS